jgi:hypothetical protein
VHEGCKQTGIFLQITLHSIKFYEIYFTLIYMRYYKETSQANRLSLSFFTHVSPGHQPFIHLFEGYIIVGGVLYLRYRKD